MIKFEEHDNQLFRMLDKPVPLTTDAKLPCLVRLIQDDSRMGMFNRDTKPSRLSDFYLAARIVSNNIVVDEFMESDYNRFEIIGYPVADGSKEWALYQMMQGETVTFLDYPNRTLKLVNGYIQDSISDGFWNRKSGNEFLSYASSTGWQLYKEPKPKPLLADAKVGDLCKRMDGKWVQIETLCSLGGMPWICYEIGGLRYINNGEQLNTKDRNLDIIDYHPLAPEGSAEWAWQMVMLGKTVYNPSYHYSSSHGLITPNMLGNCSKQSFVDRQEPSGWQLYKEPKPEQQNPMPTTEFVDLSDAPAGWICKTRDGGNYPLKYIEVSPTRYAYEDKSGLTVYVMANGHYKKNGTDGRDIIACEPEPEPKYKAGDFVEIINWYSGTKHLGQIDSIDHEIHIGTHRFDISGKSVMERVPQLSIIHKLKPSEVIVKIGCLSGTVRPVSTNGIHIWFHLIGVDDKTIATIRITALDARTRELVESLLEAMRGKE